MQGICWGIEENFEELIIFGGVDGAGGIDEFAVGGEEGGGLGEELELEFLQG